ncbi:MAG: Ig-like domain-containing protein, partial [Candidatus Binataceae bacterium]
LMYGPETWWNGSAANPETGEGGFGISKFFAAANYQTVLTGSSMRSVPDVVMSGDPAAGVFICQASDGGCPTGLEYGGTSIAAPEWAAMAALLNEGQGSNLGLLNPHLYPLANTSAFHNAAALGSDLAHVGLGSPNLNLMYLALTGQSAGIPSATLSQIDESLPVPASGIVPNGVPADGATPLTVLVALRDANGNSVSGKTVTLSAGAGTSAVVTPSSAMTTSNNGVASFTVTDLTVENLSFTATDSGDGVQVSQSFQIPFVTPPAASAALNAAPSTVTADGVTSTGITVTLEDSLGRPSPGKQIQITQTGNSLITGPTPPVTDSDGEIQFTATDTNNETVTYSATDVTDGNLPFPGNAEVTFSDAPEPNCGNQTPVAAPGYVVTPYVTGFLAQNFSYANNSINYGGCPGASGIAFDTSGNIFVSDLPSGDIYKLPSGGGAVSNSNLINSTLGPAGGDLVYENGNLYAVQGAIPGDGSNSGTVTQINPSTGAVIGTVATGLNCPQKMAADPLTGDLFVDDACTAPAGNPALIRISNLGGSPTTSTYATLPNETNYEITFAPDGTIYVMTGVNFGNNYSGTVVEVGGTNTTQPAAVATISSIAPADEILLAAGTASGGGAQYLISGSLANIPTSSGLGTFDLTSNPPSAG